MRVFFRPLVESQLGDIRTWYEAERPGLSRGFDEEFINCVSNLAEFPRMYPVVLPGIRRAALQRFRYSLFYSIEPDHVEILSIFHDSRDPNQLEVRDSSWIYLHKGVSGDPSWMPRPEMQIAS